MFYVPRRRPCHWLGWLTPNPGCAEYTCGNSLRRGLHENPAGRGEEGGDSSSSNENDSNTAFNAWLVARKVAANDGLLGGVVMVGILRDLAIKDVVSWEMWRKLLRSRLNLAFHLYIGENMKRPQNVWIGSFFQDDVCSQAGFEWVCNI